MMTVVKSISGFNQLNCILDCVFVQPSVECFDLAVVKTNFLKMPICVVNIYCAHYAVKDSVKVDFVVGFAS